MAQPTLKEQLEKGNTTVGTFQSIPAAAIAEMTGLAGMDFTILDQEHGPLTAESSLPLCAAAERGGASPIVRVRENSPSEIQRALDVGAAGVEIPQIETREDAEAAVAAARFDPLGERGLSPCVRAGGYDGSDNYTTEQNEETLIAIHVEGQGGLNNLDGILDVEGIDVVFLGPYDLSQSLGIPGQVTGERVEETMEEVCSRARNAGKIVGTYADTPELANRWIDVGVQYVAISVDATLLKGRFAEVADAVDTS
jgi:4-hydroxy-2-oxoheptanedioate aldolase